MNRLSPERKKIVMASCAVACMSGGLVLLREHRVLLAVWIFAMFSMLVYAYVELAKLKRRGL